jgi:hypothetical protein
MSRLSMLAYSPSQLGYAVHAIALAATLLPGPVLAAQVIRVCTAVAKQAIGASVMC